MAGGLRWAAVALATGGLLVAAAPLRPAPLRPTALVEPRNVTAAAIEARTAATIGGVCSTGPYLYAAQWTATDTGQSHDGCGIEANVFAGFTGIEGQITTPAAVPALDANRDHDAGWIGVYWLAGSNIWLQIGWYTGIIGALGSCSDTNGSCARRSGTLGMYVEYQQSDGLYAVVDLGSLSPGERVEYRVEYTPAYGSGCWTAYFDGDSIGGIACGLPAMGSMWAVNELADVSGTGHMGSSEFGSATPGRGGALRLQGCGTAYEDWGASLKCGPGGTRESDVRTGAAGTNYELSVSSTWDDLRTYQD